MSTAATSSGAMLTLTPGDIGGCGRCFSRTVSPKCLATSSFDLQLRYLTHDIRRKKCGHSAAVAERSCH